MMAWKTYNTVLFNQKNETTFSFCKNAGNALSLGYSRSFSELDLTTEKRGRGVHTRLVHVKLRLAYMRLSNKVH